MRFLSFSGLMMLAEARLCFFRGSPEYAHVAVIGMPQVGGEHIAMPDYALG